MIRTFHVPDSVSLVYLITQATAKSRFTCVPKNIRKWQATGQTQECAHTHITNIVCGAGATTQMSVRFNTPEDGGEDETEKRFGGQEQSGPSVGGGWLEGRGGPPVTEKLGGAVRSLDARPHLTSAPARPPLTWRSRLWFSHSSCRKRRMGCIMA